MKKRIMIPSIALAVVIGIIIGYWVIPKVHQPPYTEVEFQVSYPDIYHINIFAEEGATIEGNWKSDHPVYTWYTSPGGVMYGLGKYGDEPLSLSSFTQAIQVPHYYHDNEIVYLPATYGGELDCIMTKLPYGSTGYYTIFFKPFDENETADITLRYRVR